MATKEWFTVQELAGMPGMALTVRGIQKWAQKNLDSSRPKARGKGREYALKGLPPETQTHIQHEAMAAAFSGQRLEARYHQERLVLGRDAPVALPQAVQDDIVAQATEHLAKKWPAKPAKPAKKPGTALAVRQPGGVQADGSCVKGGQVRRVKTVLGDKDRATQDAGLLLMLALDEASTSSGTSVRKAARVLATSIMNASAAPALQQAAVTVYVKPRGNLHLGGLDALTARLQKMHGFYQEGCKQGKPAAFLIAGRPEKRGPKPEHLRAFLHFYCLPNRPTVMQAWKNAQAWYAEQGLTRPAVDSWYRLEKDLPVTAKYRGRMTGSAYKTLLPYVSRDESMFKSNDIWVGDGHTFKARVQSPIHGNAFRPEVTFIIDWRSRKLVGWSVALSENVVAVSDAFRHAQITTRARPLIYYSDNGSGQTAKHIDHPIHGTMGRQGIAHETGIPGNPQGRGIIERIWAITVIPLAATYATFLGKQGDKETIRKVGVALEKAKRKGEDSRFLPSWGQFMQDLNKCVDDYNMHHSHSGLDGMTPNEAYAKHMDPDSLALCVEDAELHALWMPEEVRTFDRGLIQLFNNEYACPELMGVLPEKAKVRVRFDIHNADTVRILDLASGKFLGLGVWDGHRRAAFPVPYVENLRDKRQAGIHRRAQGEMDRADDERLLTFDATGGQVLPFGPLPAYREASLIAPATQAQITPKTAQPESPKPAPQSYAERVFGAQVEAEERARAAAVNATPEPVLSYAERLLQHQERQAQEAARRAPEPVIETYAQRLLRQIEEEDDLKALNLLPPESDLSDQETSRKAV